MEKIGYAMKIVLTGATGQLGKSLQMEIRELDHDLVSFSHSELDISNYKQVEMALMNVKPHCVINAAAYTNVPSAENEINHAMSVNAYGPINLAIATEKISAKLIQISTNFLFDGVDHSWVGVTTPAKPLNFYGVSKLAGELGVVAHNPQNSFIVRTSSLYSENGNNFLTKILGKLKNSSKEINVVSDQYCQPTYTRDLAKQIVKLIQSDSTSGIYHFVNNGHPSWFEFAKQIAIFTGYKEDRVVPISFTDFDDGVKRPAAALLMPTPLTNFDPIDRTWTLALADCLKGAEI